MNPMDALNATGRTVSRRPNTVAVITVGRSPTDPAVSAGFPKDKGAFFLLDGSRLVLSKGWKGPRREPLEGSEAWNGEIRTAPNNGKPYRYIVDSKATGRTSFRARLISYDGGVESGFVCASAPGSKTLPPYGRPWCSSSEVGLAQRFDARSKTWQDIDCEAGECEHYLSRACKVRTLIEVSLLEPGFEGITAYLETGSVLSLGKIMRTFEDVRREWERHRDLFGVSADMPWTGLEVLFTVSEHAGSDDNGNPRNYPLIGMTFTRDPLEVIGERIKMVSGVLPPERQIAGPTVKQIAASTMEGSLATVIQPVAEPARRDGQPTASQSWGKARDKAQEAIQRALTAIDGAESLEALDALWSRFTAHWPGGVPDSVKAAHRSKRIVLQEPDLDDQVEPDDDIPV